MLSPAFQDILHVSKLRWESDLLLISRASLDHDFVELQKMQFNVNGVEHDLRLIERIESRLYNVEDTQRVILELGNKYTNKQRQLRKLCFFNWETLYWER